MADSRPLTSSWLNVELDLLPLSLPTELEKCKPGPNLGLPGPNNLPTTEIVVNIFLKKIYVFHGFVLIMFRRFSLISFTYFHLFCTITTILSCSVYIYCHYAGANLAILGDVKTTIITTTLGSPTQFADFCLHLFKELVTRLHKTRNSPCL